MAWQLCLYEKFKLFFSYQCNPGTPVSGLKRNLMDEMMNSGGDHSGRNTLNNSPRAMATSLEGGLDDVDLLAIGQGSPISDIIQRVLGTSN